MASDPPVRGGTYPPYGVITNDDHGSYVIIATWIFACVSVLFVLVRVVLRTWTARRFGLDNAFIVAALVCFYAAVELDTSDLRPSASPSPKASLLAKPCDLGWESASAPSTKLMFVPIMRYGVPMQPALTPS